MQKKNNCLWLTWIRSRCKINILLQMKLTSLLLTGAFCTIYATATSQTITLSVKKLELKEVFTAVKRQTGYVVFYNQGDLAESKLVSVTASALPLADFLKLVLKDQPLEFRIRGNSIILSRKAPVPAPGTVSPPDNWPVTIVVVASDGTPLTGATIRVKNSSQSAATGPDGSCTLNVSAGDVLVASYVGFDSGEITIKTASAARRFTIALNTAISKLDATVVVAYNTTTQRRSTGAVAVVKGEAIAALPNRSFDRSLQGTVPGLLVTGGNGQPGGGTSNMLIRGIATAISGSARLPLFVIDGVPVTQDMTQRSFNLGTTAVTNPLAQINPGDVESYTVLKDAAAIALYGSKASNGVILITTKKGHAGKTNVKFRQQVDVASLIHSREPDVLNKDEYVTLLREAYKNANSTLWTDATIDADLKKRFPYQAKAPGDSALYEPSNWKSLIYNNAAITTNTELSLSGGNDKTLFYLNLGYLDQKGIVKASGYKRASIRYNFSTRPASWINLGLNTSFSFNRQETPSQSESPTDLFGFPYTAPPVYPAYLQNGAYYLPSTTGTNYNLSNPAAALQWNVNRSIYYRAMGTLFAETYFLKHFKFRTDLGGDFMLSQDKTKTDLRLPISTIQGLGEVSAFDRVRTRIISTNVLQYNNIFRQKHSLQVLLGQEAQTIYANSIAATSRGFSAPYFEEVAAGSTVVYGSLGTTGNSSKETQRSFFSQANYNYDSKYLLSGSVRRDGSSKFGANNRYGNYWSLGAGWVISNEPFMQKTAHWLSYLKLRGSMGTAGNSSSLTATTRYSILSLGGNYDGAATAMLSVSPGNPDIKWERQFSKDLGLEFNLFKNRFGAGVDLYHRLTSHLIYLVTLPGSSGYSFGFGNVGDMMNKGIEVSVNAAIIHNKEFKWSIDANWSTNQNKLVKAYQKESISGYQLRREGQPFNAVYMVRWAGVNSQDGTPQWYDINGKITSNYSLDNRVIAGQIQPKGFGGITNTFSYHAIQLSAFLYYQYGNMLYDNNTAALQNDGTLPYLNQSKAALDRWQHPGDQAKNPRRVLNNPDGGTNTSTRYLSPGDFIRLKNVTLSYNLPVLARSAHMSNIRMYVQGNNLALWTKYTGIDPENVTPDGNTAFPYPQTKTYSLGVDVSF